MIIEVKVMKVTITKDAIQELKTLLGDAPLVRLNQIRTTG
ncbi:hypothetical protein JOC76_000474 [Neobacillus cucumis]|jgi:hypothetical protein|nr:hypothetical protein [Neobacillus cucumis]